MKQLLYFILSIIIIINQKTLYCSELEPEQYNADNLYEKFIDKKQDLTSISSSNKNLENNNEIEMVDRWFKIDTTSELLFVLKESGESYKQLMRIYEFANAEPNNTIKKYINENYLINPIRIGFCLLCFQEISNIDKSILNYVLNAFINYIINDVYPGSYVPKILFYMNNDFNTDIGNAILLRIKEEKNKGKKISLTLLLFKYREFYRLPKEQRYKHYDIIIDYLQDLSLVITCQLDCGNFFDEEYITNKLRRRNGGASGAICLILLINNTLYRYDNIQKSIYFDIIDTDCKKIIKNEIIVKCKNHTTNNKINILDIMQLSRNRIRSTLQKELEGIPFNQLKESYLMLLLTKNKQDSLSQNEQHVLIESLDKEIKNIEDENSIYNNMKCFSVTRNMAINIIEYYIQSITSKKQFIPYLLFLVGLETIIDYSEFIIPIIDTINVSSITKLKFLLCFYYKIYFRHETPIKPLNEIEQNRYNELLRKRLWRERNLEEWDNLQDRAELKLQKKDKEEEKWQKLEKQSCFRCKIKNLINQTLNNIKEENEYKNIETITNSLIIDIEKNHQKIFFDVTFIINPINQIIELYKLGEGRRYSMYPFFNKMKDYIKYSNGSASLIVEQKPYSFLSQNYFSPYSRAKYLHLLSNNNITKNTESHIDNKFNKKNPNQKNPLLLIGSCLTCLAIIAVKYKYYHYRAPAMKLSNTFIHKISL